MKVKEVPKPGTKDAYLAEARRKLANAKAVLKDVAIEDARYMDYKYVQMAAGIAYLAALEVINAVAPVDANNNQEAESIEEYRKAIRMQVKSQQNHLLHHLETTYDNLLIGAYYRRMTSVPLVIAGLDSVKKLIELAETLPDPRLRKAA